MQVILIFVTVLVATPERQHHNVITIGDIKPLVVIVMSDSSTTTFKNDTSKVLLTHTLGNRYDSKGFSYAVLACGAKMILCCLVSSQFYRRVNIVALFPGTNI